MVPMLTCGFVRSNFAFATWVLLWTARASASVVFGRACRARGWPRPGTTGRWPSLRQGSTPGQLRSSGAWGALRCSLARRLRDDLLRHVGRNLGVGVEHHRVARPPLGPRPQVADVAEHLRERHQGPDDAGSAALLHRLDHAAPGVEVADHVTHVGFRGDDLDG